jgi:uncharacterized cofD-like protein
VSRPIGTEPETLLEELKLSNDGPSVVAIGGGHGLAQALMAVRGYAGRIDAIVSVADDGGSSGRLSDLDIPPPGDIRKCLIALTPGESVWRRLFEYRFEAADVTGHSLGNLIIAALAEIEGSFEAALLSSERLLGSVGSVIPASPLHLRLEAVINGATVAGQVNIQHAQGVIEEIRVLPAGAPVSPHAIEAIAGADQIVIGPGSLYTSSIAALLVPGIVEELNLSRARLVYVANLITQDAETLGMDAADHVEAILRLTGVRSPSAIVANDAPLAVEAPLESLRVDGEVLATYGVDVVSGNLLEEGTDWPSHDPGRLGEILAGLVDK